MRLIAKERILLYLLEAGAPREAGEVSPDLTQDGIARGCWVELRHVRQFVRPLIEDGLVQERQAHVVGARQRRQVYELTYAGRAAALRLRERVAASAIRVQDEAGMRETTIAEALRGGGNKASLLGLVRCAQGAQPVQLGAGMSLPSRSFVAMLTGAPRVETFVGRRRELQALCAEGKAPRVFVVRGVAGIGKSSLAAAACEALRGTRNLYWRRVRPWDSGLTILAGLGDFLAALGRRDVRSALNHGETDRAIEAFKRNLVGTRAFLVFDDVHEATPDALAGLRTVVEAIGEARDGRALFLTRRSLRFYNRRDVELTGLVREMDLQGLEPFEVASLMTSRGLDPRTAKLARRLGGHPLFLELLRSSDVLAGDTTRLTSVRKFIDEEIYRELSGSERKMMKLAALYRTPVPGAALFGATGLTYDVLLLLQERSLVRGLGEDRFESHDAIRDYFASVITEEERATLAPFAIGQLRRLASLAQGAGNYSVSVDALSNALELPMSGGDRIALLEALGDVKASVGDLPGTLKAYQDGAVLSADPETVARFHRKTARAYLARYDPRAAADVIDQGLKALGAVKSLERGWLEGMRGAILAWTDRSRRDEAIASLESARDAFREHGEKVGEMDVLLLLGFFRQFLGDLDQAERCYQETLELAASAAHQEFVANAHARLAYHYAFLRSDLTRALDHLRALESMAPHLDFEQRAYFLRCQAQIRAEILVDFGGAEASVSEYVALGRRACEPMVIFAGTGDLATLAYYRGKVADACARYERHWRESLVARWLAFTWPIENGVNSLSMAAQCCILQGDRSGFERLVAELDLPGIQDRMTDRTIAVHVLRGLSAFIRREETAFQAAFAHGLDAAKQSFTTQAPPFEVPAYAIPYFYGIALEARGKEDEGAPYIARALDHLQARGMKARYETLLRDRSGFVRVLREWAAEPVVAGPSRSARRLTRPSQDVPAPSAPHPM